LTTHLAVMGSGMVTPLGFNAPSTLAALRAGLSAVGETGWVDFESGEPLRGAKVDLPQWWEGLGKLADLVAPAIDECLQTVDPASRAAVPVLIGVAAPDRPGRFAGLDDNLLDEVLDRLDLPRHPRSAMLAADQAGCAQALVAAREIVERREATRVVVAGVDSFLHQPTLNELMGRRRLMTPSNSNGFFPSEAGCAVLVGQAGTSDGDELRIHGQGFAVESATIHSTEPLRARGLTQAAQQALRSAGVKLKDIAYRLTDLSGEHYKFKEALFTAGRLSGGDSGSSLELWHPIEFLGEIGAAILPCLLAQAIHASQQGYAPGPLALCHVGSDAGLRAAFVVGVNRDRERSA
jgi:3-oxoacyl-[acyl-carrier-protein] synthase I